MQWFDAAVSADAEGESRTALVIIDMQYAFLEDETLAGMQ